MKDKPLRVRPVGVTHSANMVDPVEGDLVVGVPTTSFNKDSLLRLVKVEDGTRHCRLESVIKRRINFTNPEQGELSGEED